MNREDERRYLVVGSVILEVVTPLFQQKIENDYTTGGFGSLQAFMNSPNVIHTLFHLRHRNSWCCKDNTNCRNHIALPLVYCQWKKLYSENPGPGIHNCHCKFTANPVQLNELDISLSSLILLNCCNLSQPEAESVQLLRQYKNDYLSHNTTGCITQTEYNTLWPDLVTYVLKLDPTKQDDLVRIENRPLDESLCKKYFIFLLDLHQQIEEINSTMQDVHSSIQSVSSALDGLNSSVQTTVNRMDTTVQGMDTTVQGMDTTVQGMDTTVQGMGNSVQGIETSVQQTNYLLKELLQKGLTCECGRQIIIPLYTDQSGRHGKQYLIGQAIFNLHQQISLTSLFNGDEGRFVTDIKMMDDGRLVFCVLDKSIVLICNTDGSNADSIPIRGTPYCITTVNSSTVAIIVVKPYRGNYIELYDINYKIKLKGIQVPGMKTACGISTINNKLVVGGLRKLMIVSHQREETIQTIKLRCTPEAIHATEDKIFFKNHRTRFISNEMKKLKWYSLSRKEVQGKILPSNPCSITSLRDGSLYVLCINGSIHHVSGDLKDENAVDTNNVEALKSVNIISCNAKQNTMVLRNNMILSIFQIQN